VMCGFCISNRFVRQSLCLEHPVYKVDIIYSVPTIHAHIPYGNDGHTCREEGAFSNLGMRWLDLGYVAYHK
jgi:hypothetical protein